MRSFKLSYAGPGDVDLLAQHRASMWRDIHPEFAKQVDRHRRATRSWIKKQLYNGKLVGFIVRAPDGRVAGSGCIWIREEQPRPTSMRFEVPYLMSMYTEKEFRRRGVAKLIVNSALEWSKKHNYDRLVLHASKMGRPVYESFGFEPSSEMRFRFET